MSTERRARLNKIGFVWNGSRGPGAIRDDGGRERERSGQKMNQQNDRHKRDQDAH
jgi:hypothetical protein